MQPTARGEILKCLPRNRWSQCKHKPGRELRDAFGVRHAGDCRVVPSSMPPPHEPASESPSTQAHWIANFPLQTSHAPSLSPLEKTAGLLGRCDRLDDNLSECAKPKRASREPDVERSGGCLEPPGPRPDSTRSSLQRA